MSKWIKASKSSWGLSASVTFLDKVNFYAGKTDHWGISFDINFYDRALTLEILNLYCGVEIWHSLSTDELELGYEILAKDSEMARPNRDKKEQK